MNSKLEFVVADYHIKMLQQLNVSWEDAGYDGAPTIDLKRPYGNSDVMGDIHEIITGKEPYDEYEDGLPDELIVKYQTIHREMEIVLEILVHTLSITPGKYSRKEWWDPWQKAA